jgi:hypothetical protein
MVRRRSTSGTSKLARSAPEVRELVTPGVTRSRTFDQSATVTEVMVSPTAMFWATSMPEVT